MCFTIWFLLSLSISIFAQSENRKFVYQNSSDLGSAIHVQDLNMESNIVILDDQFSNLYPVLSPDSTQIAFTSNRDGDFDLYIIDIATSSITQLTNTLESEMEPSWSTNGNFITYIIRSNLTSKIAIYSLQADTTYDILNDGNLNFEPNFSPNEDKIIFTSVRGNFRPLYELDLSSNITTLLTPIEQSVFAPRWSANGEFIAFRDKDSQIYILDLNSLNISQLTNELETSSHIWQSSDHILYTVPLEATYIVKRNGTAKQEVQISFPSGVSEISFAFNTTLVAVPTSNAGFDQNLVDNDNNGFELVTLDGSGSSDNDGTIVSYSWTENGIEIATGIQTEVNLAVGMHTITLTVTDDDGLTDEDEVVITVLAPTNTPTFTPTFTLTNTATFTPTYTHTPTQTPAPPIANAGPDQVVVDVNNTGSESVRLNGSGSTDRDGIIASYVWKNGVTQIATGLSPIVDLAVGTHTPKM